MFISYYKTLCEKKNKIDKIDQFIVTKEYDEII